ncbi:phosphatidate cytidylyltransferase [Brevundimonas variabilis]|uniref:Phosphatidate cytidylyltransferase n=1 Tax=Brevundimonas variabilis TaxID=74312 RepID=A0A7W9CI02_9CAUL|nr:phosphatidate cytidylyltransferase [Brevundimonas variabilis]MBB5745758.1 phosphatidate cytidylyltransferase [Brevundimonas variabilis]
MAVRVGDIGLRAASAVVLAPAALLATWAGGLWFLALVLIGTVLLAMEWATMSAPRNWRTVTTAVTAALFVSAILMHLGHTALSLIMLVVGAGLAGMMAKLRRDDGVDAAYGVLYLGWPIALLIWLRDVDSAVGLTWTALVFVVAWSSDILAYLVGSTVGGPKLWPRFSPNKTWSGFLGGLVAGMVAGAAMAGWLDMGRLNVFWGGGLGLAAALATMAGDLWESALKRRFGVKDSGTIIPGHGGLLDRVDGLMFAIVVVATGRVLVNIMERAG